MMILNPPFLREQPRRSAQLAALLALLWTSLPLASALPPVVTALFFGLWLLRAALLRLNVGKIPLAALVLMLAMVGVLVWQQLGTLFGREGGVAFLLLLVCLKSFEGNTRRDWQVLLLAMLFLIGSSVLLNQSLAMGAWLLSSLLAVSVCFAMLCGVKAVSALRRSGQALLLTLPLMAVLFVGVPRLSEPLWRIPQAGQGEGQAQTGLSDTMEPGSISNLVQSNVLVANVVFEAGTRLQRSDLYWRALIMADFDGRSWRAVDRNLVDEAAPAAGGNTVQYQMIVADQKELLPALDYPVGSLPDSLQIGLGDIVRARRSREGLRRLSLQASVGDTLPHELSEAEHFVYTRLPEGNMQTRMLADNLFKRAANTRQFVDLALYEYRRRQFSYTLQPPLLQGRDVVDDFMFQTKQGFCEHYAQSFVVMMRAAGIPARVVAGYLGGDYHEQGGFWQIRSRDAHAWTEVWLPEEKVWLRVDPTATVSSNRIELGLDSALPEAERNLVAGQSNGWLGRAANVSQFYWQQWVVNYDQTRQNNLFQRLGLGGFNLKSVALVLGVGLLLALLPVLRWWRRGRLHDQSPLNEGFLLLKTALLGEDDDNLPGMSAGDLKRLMRDNGMEDETIVALLNEYERWLYAEDQIPAPAQQRAWLRRAKKAAKPYWGKP